MTDTSLKRKWDELGEEMDALAKRIKEEEDMPFYEVDDSFQWKADNQEYHFVMIDSKNFITMRRVVTAAIVRYSIANFSQWDHFYVQMANQRTVYLVSAIMRRMSDDYYEKGYFDTYLDNISPYISTLTTAVDWGKLPPPRQISAYDNHDDGVCADEVGDDHRWSYTTNYYFEMDRKTLTNNEVSVFRFVVERPRLKLVMDFDDVDIKFTC